MESKNGSKNFVIFIALFIFFYHFGKPIIEKANSVINSKKELQEYTNNYNICVEQYNNKQFEESAYCFKKLREVKDDYNVKYMHAVSLGLTKNYAEAVLLLDEIINDETINNEDIKIKAKSAYNDFLKHKKMSEAFLRNDVGNYMGDLHQIARWGNSDSLKVYIYDDYNKKAEIKKAFQKWDDELRSIVNFTYVNNPELADITAKAVDISELEKGYVGITENKIIYYENNKNKLFMQKADIKVSYNKIANSLWTDEEFRGITLHEIGHALGIQDHSKNRGDIMYHDISTYCKGTVSNRDVGTMRRIYGSII